jgi:hypothetical protein
MCYHYRGNTFFYYLNSNIMSIQAAITVFPVNKHPNYPKGLLGETKVKYTIPYSSESRQVLRPLTENEEKELFPKILSISVDDLSFRDKVTEYYKSLSVPISYDGLVLEITPEEVANSKVPENIVHFLLYRALLLDKNVATDDEDVKNNYYFTYYVVNGQKEQEEKEKVFEIQKKVDVVYMNIINRENNKPILRSLNILFRKEQDNTVMEINSMSNIELEMSLKEICVKYPQQFYNQTSSEQSIKRLQVKADAEAYVDSGLVTLVGNQIEYDGSIIAKTLTEFKKLLSSAEGSKTYAELQVKFKEIVK